jgi:two-component system OmpR family response regulator
MEDKAASHILVVEDDANVRELIVDALTEQGYRVSQANGGVAMRTFIDGHDPVQAIVLDTTMRGEQGPSLALHAKSLGLPVVMISGAPAAMEFAQAHGLQLLWKPFKIHDLVAALDKAIASHSFGQREV